MNYTMSRKRKKEDSRRADWDQRIQIFMLRNQGWTFESIGKHLGISKQFASLTYNKIKDMTIGELNELV